MQRLLPCSPPGAAALWLVVLALPFWIAAAPTLRASGCTGCAPPSLATLQAQPGFALTPRPKDGDPTVLVPDQVHLDAGECIAELVAPPHVVKLNSWLVLRGTGEVWDCPHSRSVDTITVQTSQTDSTTWSVTGSVGLKLGTVMDAVTAELSKGNTTGATITEITSVSKTITPGYCHRIQWSGFFEIATYKATAEFKFRQRWAWWTKNVSTGSTVHAKGDVWVDCYTGTVELGRQAPIAGIFELDQRACKDAACGTVVPKHLGFFPELPPYPASPTTEASDPPVTESPPAEPTTTEPDAPTSEGLGDSPTGPIPNPLSAEEDR